MHAVKHLSPWHFTVFRIVFGSYLAIHFLHLAPYAAELFSNQGLLPDPSVNFTFGILPNPLEIWGTPLFATGFVTGLGCLSILFALGLWRPVLAVILWFGWACLFNRNNLISNPGIPYVGFLLLVSALVPTGEPLSLSSRIGRSAKSQVTPAWRMPAVLYWSVWILLALGYSYSGFWKCLSPSWIDGTAMHHVLANPLARDTWLNDLLLNLPLWIVAAMTWFALAGECLAAPLSLTRRGRLISWTWMVSMHVGVLVVIDFADLTFGMLMAHLFTFDPEWLPARNDRKGLVLFDGNCGLCNGAVRFLIQEDAAGALQFSPLQGNTARPFLDRHGIQAQNVTTMLWIENPNTPHERVHTRSDAFLGCLDACGGMWRVVSWLRWIPQSIRDGVYDTIAANRIRWFGTAKSCPLPQPRLVTRILP